MIKFERVIRKVLLKTSKDKPVLYDPAKSKMLDRKKHKLKTSLQFKKESKQQRKIQFKKFRQENKQFCRNAKKVTFELLDDLCVEPLIKNTEGWHTW